MSKIPLLLSIFNLLLLFLLLLLLFLLLTLASRGSKIHVFLAKKIFFGRGHLFLHAEIFLFRFLVLK